MKELGKTVLMVTHDPRAAERAQARSTAILLEQLRVIEDAPEVARDAKGPLGSPEEVVVAAPPLASTGTDANVQLRGVGPRALEVRDKVHIVQGRFIEVLGALVAAVMGLGALFAALNTMYTSVAERTRGIATIRTIGFGAGTVIASFVLESLLIALVGGILGGLATLPLNGLVTQTMNLQSFSHVSFAFQVSPPVLAALRDL